MKQILLLAGAAMLASTGPALAKPGHANHGGKGKQARVFDDRGYYAPGLGACPPGLAKKTPRCMPPGQAKNFAIGQRIPYGYQGLLGYNQLPYDVRNQYGYGLDPYSRYIYQDQYLYRVDPTTMIVQQILRAVL